MWPSNEGVNGAGRIAVRPGVSLDGLDNCEVCARLAAWDSGMPYAAEGRSRPDPLVLHAIGGGRGTAQFMEDCSATNTA